jgi:NADPH:quinone reductase
MNDDIPQSTRQLTSLITAEGLLELALAQAPLPAPGPDEIVVRVEAAPLNPSDLNLMLAGADLGLARSEVTDEGYKVIAPIPQAAFSGLTGRIGLPIAIGNEGAGRVIAVGSSKAAKELLGATVAARGAPMYSEYRTLNIDQCLTLPPETSAAAVASCFVNPLTALGMIETMRAQNHSALVHTAAASNLGQMLVKICASDGVPLVNIVRRHDQAELLRSLGAKHVCISSAESFMADLTEAIRATKATLAFDATGGGMLAGQILSSMEQAIAPSNFSRYGSTVHKQVYIYGSLDPTPISFSRNFGMAWGMGGWYLTTYLERLDAATLQRLRARVASEVTTTFASSYAKEISLNEALDLDTIRTCARLATGEKFLINPAKR